MELAEHEEGRPPTGQPAPSNLIVVSQTDSNAKPIDLNSHSTTASSRANWLQGLAGVDAWLPWLEFVDSLRVMLGLDTEFHRPGIDRPSTLWRAVRPASLESLVEMGLVATVVSSTGTVPIAEHPGDLAGHVRIGRRVTPESNSVLHDEDLTAEQSAIAAGHGLKPAAVPRATLRQFVGQWTAENEPQLNASLFSWFDHALAWADADGAPVLSIEPSTDWPMLWSEITAALLVHEIPLILQGPYPGEHSDDGQVFLLRFDPTAAAVPAEHVTSTPWATSDSLWQPVTPALGCRGQFGCVGVGCQLCSRCDCDLPVCPRCLRCAEHAIFGEDATCRHHLWWSPAESCWLEAAS